MAEQAGEGRYPSERRPWGEAFQTRSFETLITPDGLRAFEDALSVYAPYTTDEFEESPALAIEKGMQVQPLLDRAAEGVIKTILDKYLDRKKILDVDILVIISSLHQAILMKYPESETPGCRFSEGLLINPLIERVQGYLMSIVALKEEKHRKKTMTTYERDTKGTQRRIETPVHAAFFEFITLPGQTSDLLGNTQLPKPSTMDPLQSLQRRLSDQYKAVKLWIAFLGGNHGNIQNPESKSHEALKAENDKVSALLRDRANKDFPSGVTIEGLTSLYGEESPLMLHVTGMQDSQMPQFHQNSVMASYLDAKEGSRVIADPNASRDFIPQKVTDQSNMELFIFRMFGVRPLIALRRSDGELSSPFLDKETLKFIAEASGNKVWYELLRSDILWNLSQLVCGRATLHEMWGGTTFAPRETGAPREKTPIFPPPTDDDPNLSPEIIRRFPSSSQAPEPSHEALATAAFKFLAEGERSDLAIEPDSQEDIIPPEDVEEAVDDTLEEVQTATAREREHDVSGHRKLLELIKRRIRYPDGREEIRIVAAKPSKQAVAAARKPLRRGFEIPDAGIVIKPEGVDAALAKFKVSTLEELEAAYPNQGHIRYETWVEPYKRGNRDHGRIDTIRGRVKEKAAPTNPT